MPVFAAERTAWQRVLHDIEELPVAGEDLYLPILEQVVRTTDARCDLLAKVEPDRGTHCTVRRDKLFIEPQTEIERQTMPHGPAILDVDSMVVAVGFSGGDDAVLDKEIARIASATRTGRLGRSPIGCAVG